MLKRGDHIFLKLTEEGVYLNDRELVKAENISIGLIPHRNYHLKCRPCWIKVLVMRNNNGALDCDIITENPGEQRSFSGQDVAAASINKLLLTWFDLRKLEAYFAGNSEKHDPTFEYDWGSKSGTPSSKAFRAPQTFIRKSGSAPTLPISRFIRPEPESQTRELQEVEHEQTFRFRFDEMQIVDGAAVFRGPFTLPGTFHVTSIEMRVSNDFLLAAYDSIKSYLSNCLKRKTIDVKALVRCKGREILNVEAESDVVAKINSSLLDDVRYRYIRRELRKDDEEANIVTVDDLFMKVKDSGLQPSDRQFIDDLIELKKPKHSENVKMLSSMHLFDLVKIRVQKYPFGFVFFVSGKQGCFFVLETLDRKDATYLWRLGATLEKLRQNPALLSEFYATVEQEMTIIADEGREPYLNDTPDNFCRVRHDYESANGFETWKFRLHEVLDGEGDS